MDVQETVPRLFCGRRVPAGGGFLPDRLDGVVAIFQIDSSLEEQDLGIFLVEFGDVRPVGAVKGRGGVGRVGPCGPART